MGCLIRWKWMAILACGWVGCDRTADVAHYQVPSESGAPGPTASESPAAGSSDPAGTPQRMLGAIIPVEGQVWFFKAMGPVETVSPKVAEFDELIESVRFESAQQPTWTLPAGWTEQPGNQFRYATLMAGDLEVTVSTLPAPASDTAAYVLANVNRWRDQLQLNPVPLEQLEETATPTEIAGRESYRVDLTGTASASSVMRGPFQTATGAGPSGSAGPGASAASAPSEATSASRGPAGEQQAGGLRFTRPQHWRDGRRGAMRLAAFEVEQQGQTAEITLIALGPSAGSLLDNVNRWRGEINLPPVDQAQIDQDVSEVKVGDVSGQYVRLQDPEKQHSDATLAVIVRRPDRTLFIKMKGPSDVVLAEEDAFKRFVESVRFDS